MPELLIHTFQYYEETFEFLFADLADTSWEVAPTVGLLPVDTLPAIGVKRGRHFSGGYCAIVPG